jgi:hypothetical protein
LNAFPVMELGNGTRLELVASNAPFVVMPIAAADAFIHRPRD